MSLFCKHVWKIIKVIEVYDDDFNHWLKTESRVNNLPIYHKYVLQCTKCGKIKTKKI